MQGIILAAGFGKRLQPLTNNKPKALVELNGKPFLYYIIKKFTEAGINEIYINTFYHSKQIIDYIKLLEETEIFSKDIKFTVIVENEILGTGGGVKNISENFMINDNEKNENFFVVYNVDVICDVDLLDVIKFHKENFAFVTMVMQDRVSKNPIIVDSKTFNILGRFKKNTNKNELIQKNKELLAFCGIQIISYEINDQYNNSGFFSIIDTYIHLIKSRKRVLSYKLSENLFWKDIGTIKDLQESEKELKRK